MAKFTRTKARSIGQVKTKSFDNVPYVKEVVDMVELTDDFKELRILPNSAVTAGVHYLPLFNKEGEPVMSKFNKKEQATKPVFCLAWDFENACPDPEKSCPYCEARLDLREETYVEVIDRDIQEQEPSKHKPSKEETKTGVKRKDNSGSWTPIRVWRLNNTLIGRIQKLESLNKHKIDGERQAVGVDDEEYGCDLHVSYTDNSKVPPTDRYQVQKGDHSPIEEDENEYLIWDVASAIAEKCTNTEDQAQRDVDRYLKFAKGVEADDESDDDEDGDYSPEKGELVRVVTDDGEEYEGTVVKNTPKILVIEDEDEEEVTISWVDIEECEPVKKAGKKKASRRDEEDEDDDEPPRKPAKKGKKVVEEDDDEDDFDDNDDSDDEDDDPPFDDDDDSEDDEDDFDEDDDDDDEPPAKSSKRKPVSKLKVVEEDEDDFDDDDEDDFDDNEEEEEPPPKSKAKAKKPAAKSSGKRKVDFDDDDDDDDY